MSTAQKQAPKFSHSRKEDYEAAIQIGKMEASRFSQPRRAFRKMAREIARRKFRAVRLITVRVGPRGVNRRNYEQDPLPAKISS